jgi:hypothetical protein
MKRQRAREKKFGARVAEKAIALFVGRRWNRSGQRHIRRRK